MFYNFPMFVFHYNCTFIVLKIQTLDDMQIINFALLMTDTVRVRQEDLERRESEN